MIFENFTTRANMAIENTIEAARQLGHGYIGTEHLLLGLCQTGDSMAARTLSKFGISDTLILNKIAEEIGTGVPTNLSLQDVTPRLKRIIQNSVIEASHAGANLVGTEHLLMALLRESESKAAEMIRSEGADVREIFEEIVSQQGLAGADSAAAKNSAAE